MVNSNFFHQSPFGFKSFTSNGQFDKQNTLKNFVNITGYIPLISVITGIARIAFASTILIFSESEKLRSLAVLHIIRATTEILCIGLVCLVADLCFCNQDDLSSCQENNNKLPDNHSQRNSSSSTESFDTSSSDSDGQTEGEKKPITPKRNSNYGETFKHENPSWPCSTSFDAIDSNANADEQNDLEIITSLSDQTTVAINDDAFEKIEKFLSSEIQFFYFGFSFYKIAIQEISENDRADVNTQILKFIEANIHLKFKDKGDMATFSQLAKMISRIFPPNRSDILKYIFIILKEIKEIDDPHDLGKLIEIFADTPHESRLNLLKLIKSFVQFGMFKKVHFYSRLSMVIPEIQNLEIEEVINCIGQAFSKNLIEHHEVADFIKLILKMPCGKEACLEQTINLYEMLSNFKTENCAQEGFCTWLRFDILKFANLDEHVLRCTIAVLESIFKNNVLDMNPKKIKNLVELFSATEPQDRTLLKQLFINIYENKLKFTFNDYVTYEEKGKYDKYALEFLFKKLCKLPQDEREEFLEQIFKIPGWIEISYTGIDCLAEIFDIPSNDLSHVVVSTLSFIEILKLEPSKIKNKKIISNFMKSIKLISPDDRANILHYISDATARKSSIINVWQINDWENYITIIGEIPPTERKIKYDKAWEIFEEFNNNSNHADARFIEVLKSLSKIELDEWSNTIGIMNEFIEQISNDSIQIEMRCIAEFIHVMQPLSQIERKEIYNQAFELYKLAFPLLNKDLLNDFFEENLIIRIMFSLANVISERLDIYQLSKEYMNYIYQDIPKSIGQISKINQMYRRTIYDQAIELCALVGRSYTSSFNQAVVLLAKYDQENRPNIIHFISKLIAKFPQKNVSIDEIDAAVLSLSKMIPKLTNSPKTDTDQFILKFIESEIATKCFGELPWFSLKNYCEALNTSLLKVAKDEREDAFNYTMDLLNFQVTQNACSNFYSSEIFDYIQIISKVRELDRDKFYNLSICLVKICGKNISSGGTYKFLSRLLNATCVEWASLAQLFEKMDLNKNFFLSVNELDFFGNLSMKSYGVRKIGFIILQKFIENTIRINPNRSLTKELSFGGLKDNDFKVFKQLARDYQISIGRALQTGFQDNQSDFHESGMVEDLFHPIYQNLHALIEAQLLVVKKVIQFYM